MSLRGSGGLSDSFLVLNYYYYFFTENAKQTTGAAGGGEISLGSVLMVDYFRGSVSLQVNMRLYRVYH